MCTQKIKRCIIDGCLTSELNSKTVPVLSSLDPSLICHILLSPNAPYQIYLLFLPGLPCHFYLVDNNMSTEGEYV